MLSKEQFVEAKKQKELSWLETRRKSAISFIESRLDQGITNIYPVTTDKEVLDYVVSVLESNGWTVQVEHITVDSELASTYTNAKLILT